MSAAKRGSSDEATRVIQSLVSSLSKDPGALAEFKKNPSAAIGGLLDGDSSTASAVGNVLGMLGSVFGA